jgi:hypothetical protein
VDRVDTAVTEGDFEMRLRSTSSVRRPTMVETVDASLRRDSRGIEVETDARQAVPE